MTNEQRAQRLEEIAACPLCMESADGKLLRECAAMMRERKTVERDAEGGFTKNGLHLFTGPVLSGFISLVTKKGQMLYMDWHPTLEDARAAAVAWVDEQEGRDV